MNLEPAAAPLPESQALVAPQAGAGGQIDAARVPGLNTNKPNAPEHEGAGLVAVVAIPAAAEVFRGEPDSPVERPDAPQDLDGGQRPAALAGGSGTKPEPPPFRTNALTATIYDASWSNAVDSDGDAYVRTARLNWDPDVAGGTGSLTVFEKISWKLASSTTWTFLAQTTTHTITGTATADAQYRDITGSPQPLRLEDRDLPDRLLVGGQHPQRRDR